MVKELLSIAIKRAGSEEKLGKAIGYSQHAIWKAKQIGRVSPQMASKLDDWSNGFISRHELCPQVFGEKPRVERVAS